MGRGRQSITTLTDRQRDVLTLVAAGLTTKDIAARLGVTKQTVNSLVVAILDKLGADNRAEAVEIARERGILGRPERVT